MATPRYRLQFDSARTPYDARNALDITTWVAVDESATRGSRYGGAYELVAGSNITFTFGETSYGGGAAARNRKTLTVTGAAPGISDAPSDGNTYARKNA